MAANATAPLEPPEVKFTRRFVANAEAVGDARTWVAQLAAATGHAAESDTLQLLVTELATNAVRHAHGDEFCIEFDANSRVLIAVCDPSTAAPVVCHANLDDTGGRGLAIVEALSDRWGAHLQANGKCVWFELSGADAQPEA
jgi:anti-sigma regulatory factor (Ser/Thr protein kinase)